MPVKLIPPLRFLTPSSLPLSRLPAMRLGYPISSSSSRASPIFSRVFPFKLRYLTLSSRALPEEHKLGVRKFSTRSFQGRNGTGSRSNRVREEGSYGASKSLVEDEAELSDWVTELRTDSFRGRITSDEESDGDHGRSSRGGVRERESSSSFPTKRRRESDSGEFGESTPRRSKGSGELSNPWGVKRFDGGKYSDRGRRNGGFQGERGSSRESKSSSWAGGVKRFDGENNCRFRGERGSSRESKDSSWAGGVRQFDGEKNGGFRREKESFGGREMKSGFERSRASESLERSGKGLRKQVNLVDEDIDEDEDEEEKMMGGINNLLREEEKTDVEFESSAEEEEYDDGHLVQKGTRSLFLSEKEEVISKGPIISPRISSGESDSYLSETRFDQCSISSLSLKATKDAGYEKLTMVQEATLPVILKGKDVLAKAKTGTGKTVAFLLPSIEVVVKSPPIERDQRRPSILVLVICPTRELASQAAAEANTLLKYHPSIGVQVVIGGTRLALEQKRMQANPCQILVATPGRLRDHIENTAGFATRLMGVKVLVLDEADHLLDMGFRKDIEKIIAAVPKQRQTLLFSATVPEEVRQICHIALKRDHEFISTVVEGSEETHSQVKQTHIVASLDKHFPLIYTLLKEHIADDVDYKVLVFCTTAMVTRMVADLLGELKLNVREIHSRKPQSYRTRVSDEFRKSKGLILVTSDVSARGVDYPDVTLVIQVGLPTDREQYIHRLGRTGRRGKEGQGILLLAPWEEFFLSTIKDLPITKAPVPSLDPETTKKVQRALSQVEMKNKEAAYQAWLGYYNSNKKIGKDKHRLVELANDFSRSMGLDNPPAIPKLVLGKMGLKNVPGLRSK